MADGSTKEVQKVDLGDNVAEGEKYLQQVNS
jgi:hypothetical protein